MPGRVSAASTSRMKTARSTSCSLTFTSTTSRASFSSSPSSTRMPRSAYGVRRRTIRRCATCSPATSRLRSRRSRFASSLPARVSFRTVPLDGFRIGSPDIESDRVLHRGVTLGYRVRDGTDALCYLPDHEPALGRALNEADDDWISGIDLARGASLLIHDGQFGSEEYESRIGWGHSSVSDALLFARREEVEQMLLFHHDPAHDDEYLDTLGGQAVEDWTALGAPSEAVALAQEGRTSVYQQLPPRPTGRVPKRVGGGRHRASRIDLPEMVLAYAPVCRGCSRREHTGVHRDLGWFDAA